MNKKEFITCSECWKPLYSEESMKAWMGASCRHKKEHKDDPKFTIDKRTIAQIISSIMQWTETDTKNVKFCVNKWSFKEVKKYDNQTFIQDDWWIWTLDVEKHFTVMNWLKYIRKIALWET